MSQPELQLRAAPLRRKIPEAINLRYQPVEKTPLTSVPLWWFTPDRPESRERRPDRVFQAKIDQDFPGISITWHPLKKRWQVWARSNRVKTPYCRGWLLLFTLEGPNGEYFPLDERVCVLIWERTARRWKNGREYFDRIESEIQRDRERRAKADGEDRDWKARDYWNYTLIKNIGRGSKFTQHHAGD